jgi:hypothetical protein
MKIVDKIATMKIVEKSRLCKIAEKIVAKIAAKIAAEIASECRPEDVPNYSWPVQLFQRQSRVARWCIFIPKIPIWVYLRGPWNLKCCYILWSFWIFYANLLCFMAIWYILLSLVYIPPIGFVLQRKIWQPCVSLRFKSWTRLTMAQLDLLTKRFQNFCSPKTNLFQLKL